MGEELEKRIEKGIQNAQGRQNSIIIAENVPLWRPKDGEHIIDIIPYFAGPNDKDRSEGKPTHTFEYLVHKNVGPSNAWFLCLSEMYNKPCPICEHRLKLREQGADDETWKSLFPKKMNMYNIICYDKGEEEKGIQVWDVPWFYSEKNILSISKKRGRGEKRTVNFSHPINGKSISFIIEPPVSKNDYATYTGFAFEDRDYEIDEETIESTFTLDSDEFIFIPNYEDLSKIYWGSKKEEDSSDRSPKHQQRSRRKESLDNSEEEEETYDTDELMEQLEECEDLDDLQEFIDEHDIDVDITTKSKFPKTKSEIKKAILSMDEEDEEEEEEPEEDDEEEESEYSWGQIKKMKSKELLKLIEDEELDIDLDDYDSLSEKREAVADELDIAY